MHFRHMLALVLCCHVALEPIIASLKTGNCAITYIRYLDIEVQKIWEDNMRKPRFPGPHNFYLNTFQLNVVDVFQGFATFGG